MFQGGFVGSTMEFQVLFEKDFETLTTFYPQDNNAWQSFEIPLPANQSIRACKLCFTQSSDFFGRIVIYHLELY
jgi:hypothetical protein